MYKLIYIDIRGRGELVRFILSQAGEQFEDERVPVQEWPSYRAGRFDANAVCMYL